MSDVIHTRLAEGRRVAIPVEMCPELGLAPGDSLVLESSETGLNLGH